MGFCLEQHHLLKITTTTTTTPSPAEEEEEEEEEEEVKKVRGVIRSMDFDDHDDHDEEEEEEIGDLPGGVSSYGTPPPQQQHSNSTTRAAPISTKQDQTTVVGSGHRKSSSGSSGGRYRECLKNHAVGIGGHAVDGCGEFMAAGEEGTLDALKCAACNCHRNFHRKEVEGVGVGLGLLGISDAAGGGGNPTSAFHHPQQHQFPPYYRTPAGYLHHHHHHPVSALHQRSITPAPLALPSTSGGGGSRDDQEDMSDPMVGASGGVISGGGGGSSTGGPSKKRFRTKFTQEQKDRMLELAEKLGWRMQKHDEAAVQQFCSDTGVQRHVLKVWMHNNKHTLGKSPTPTASLIHQIPQVIHLQERQVIHHHHQQQHHQMGPADAEDRNIT